MATTTKNRQQLPENAQFTADLIEKLGFHWELSFEYPTPDATRRLQIREEKHYSPKDMVAKYAACMKRGDKFPPIVTTKDGWLVDGNTRVEAAHRNKYPYMQAFVIDDAYEGAKPHIKQRLHTLGAAFNARNGKGIDRREIQKAVEIIGANPDFTAVRIAALLGVTEGQVNGYIAQKRGKDRAHELGVPLNGEMTSSALQKLGRVSDKLNDGPFQALAALARDAGMSSSEIAAVARKMIDCKADHLATQIVEEEREARRDQIAMFKVTGRSKPSLSSLLRQRFGFLFTHSTEELVELNPSVAEEHLEKTRLALEKLTAVYRAQCAALGRS